MKRSERLLNKLQMIQDELRESFFVEYPINSEIYCTIGRSRFKAHILDHSPYTLGEIIVRNVATGKLRRINLCYPGTYLVSTTGRE